MTCCSGLVKEDGVGNKDQHHGRICGDVVRDGVLEALFTTATTAPDLSGKDNVQLACEAEKSSSFSSTGLRQLEESYSEMDG